MSLKRKIEGDSEGPPKKKVEQVADADCGVFAGKSSPKYRVGTDPWGYSVTLRKSDFQKAVRRGNEAQALVAFFVCFNMLTLFPGNSSAKAIQTNIINRLIICVLEDVGVANVPLVSYVVRVVGAMTQSQKTGSVARCGKLLGRVIVAMCRSEKTRIQSHMTHSYGTKNRVPATAAGVDIHDPTGNTLADPNWFVHVVNDPEMMWDKLGRSGVLHKLYMRVASRNKQAVLQYALTERHFICTGKLKGGLSTLKLPVVDVTAYIRNSVEMEPAAEARDMHTSEGRGKSKAQFRTQGATVKNQSLVFYDAVLEKLYMNSLY